VKSKRVGSSLSKLALSNALIQNANEEIVNIPTKMFGSLFSEATKTSIVPIDLLKILFRESKEPSSSVVIVDDVAKEVKTQNKKHPKPPKVSTRQRRIINTCLDKGVTTRSLAKS
jgi:hypothetical protein